MSMKNIFSGVEMTYDLVQTYYLKTPDFDHFVFQQMIDEVDIGNFTLTVYAVSKSSVLNNGNPLIVSEFNGKNFPGIKPNIQFANMNLGLSGLGLLYPPGCTSNLKVYPAGYYWQNSKETAYIYYTAETKNGKEFILTSKINPSPPA
jgi:hypothetical protein